MTNAVTLQCPAKVNFTLDVLSRRQDGYHGVETLLQSISLADRLTIEPAAAGIRMECSGPASAGVPVDGRNLAWKAVLGAWRAARGDSAMPGLMLRLEKHVPPEAGLGGGSSDAAGALTAANHLMRLELDNRTLTGLAAELGSDVPFFLHGGFAAASGRGERIQELPDLPTLWLVVVKPPVHSSTATAYRALDAVPQRKSHRATQVMQAAAANKDWNRLISGMCNDFEPAVFNDLPAAAAARDDLVMAGAITAHLCGSGSAVYGVAASEADAAAISASVRRRYSLVYTARTLSRSEASFHPGEESGWVS
ncbi:MAG: 4-(cytidine 5'-diphospho)-2-C-methyl-D-erythritol kinase [Armatimonadetes bacterium]|nr:4-(cytidine 5'-diphospho)-2-C-methyl-D-erythritol kinase [Armatimonadota bacterium]MDE2206830.1 4-(cytidine 5'-diphospho)-2-C-methyl-D-erythritol kinase [Armatimonadota bacterium]